MILPPLTDFDRPGATRDRALAQIERSINDELMAHFETHRSQGRAHLAETLVNKVEDIMSYLNSAGYAFGRVDYGGDINYENSEQTWSNGQEMSTGIILEFRGFSCKASWQD